MSATIGAMGPRYVVSGSGMYLLMIFMVGLIFLAFDVRARDLRERMAEVLEARPFSSAELLIGRTLGLVIMAWFPVLLMAFLMQSFGALAVNLGWPIGEPAEPVSMIGFMLDALTAMVFWCALIVLLAVSIKSRLVVALLALGFLALMFWAVFSLPIYIQPLVSIFSSFLSASDLVSSLNTGAPLGPASGCLDSVDWTADDRGGAISPAG